MHVLALELELRIRSSHSLKDKRMVLRSLLDGIRNRYPVAAAEVDHQDTWQRAAVGVASVSGSATVAGRIIDEVERFVWSFPDIEVVATGRQWMERD